MAIFDFFTIKSRKWPLFIIIILKNDGPKSKIRRDYVVEGYPGYMPALAIFGPSRGFLVITSRF